jgi:stress response protein YsnF
VNYGTGISSALADHQGLHPGDLGRADQSRVRQGRRTRRDEESTPERPVAAKETVPVEHVRLTKETVTEDHQVSETLRKEQIDDPDTDTSNR